jgi:hypothetical protein
MLYRGSEIMREVAWVVFDEIHYMRDASKCKYIWGNVESTDDSDSSRRSLGGDDYSSPGQSSICFPFGNYPKCHAVRRVDYQNA